MLQVSGTVTFIRDGIITIASLPSVFIEELVYFGRFGVDTKRTINYVSGIVKNIDTDGTAKAMLFHGSEADLFIGMKVYRSRNSVTVHAGHHVVGQLLRPTGYVTNFNEWCRNNSIVLSVINHNILPIKAESPGIVDRSRVRIALHAGVNSVDSFIPRFCSNGGLNRTGNFQGLMQRRNYSTHYKYDYICWSNRDLSRLVTGSKKRLRIRNGSTVVLKVIKKYIKQENLLLYNKLVYSKVTGSLYTYKPVGTIMNLEGAIIKAYPNYYALLHKYLYRSLCLISRTQLLDNFKMMYFFIEYSDFLLSISGGSLSSMGEREEHISFLSFKSVTMEDLEYMNLTCYIHLILGTTSLSYTDLISHIDVDPDDVEDLELDKRMLSDLDKVHAFFQRIGNYMFKLCMCDDGELVGLSVESDLGVSFLTEFIFNTLYSDHNVVTYSLTGTLPVKEKHKDLLSGSFVQKKFIFERSNLLLDDLIDEAEFVNRLRLEELQKSVPSLKVDYASMIKNLPLLVYSAAKASGSDDDSITWLLEDLPIRHYERYGNQMRSANTNVNTKTKRMYHKTLFRCCPSHGKLPFNIYQKLSCGKFNINDFLVGSKYLFENPVDKDMLCSDFQLDAQLVSGNTFYDNHIDSLYKLIIHEPRLNLEAASNTVNALEYSVKKATELNSAVCVVHDPGAPGSDAILTTDCGDVISCLQFKTSTGVNPVRLYRNLNKFSSRYDSISSSFGELKGEIIHDIGKVPNHAKPDIMSYLSRRQIPDNICLIDSSAPIDGIEIPSSVDVYNNGYSILDDLLYDGKLLGGIIKITEGGRMQLEMYCYCKTDVSGKLANIIDLPKLDSVVSCLDWGFLFDCGLRIIGSFF